MTHIRGGASRVETRRKSKPRLCWRWGPDDLASMRRHLASALAEVIDKEEFEQEPIWTKSLAVRNSTFVEKIKPLILSRRETEVIQGAAGMNVLRE